MLAELPRFPVYKLWLVWIAVAVAALIVKPWGSFGWDEWFAVAAPLMLIHPAVNRMEAIVVGMVASCLAWSLLDHDSGGWAELACLWSVLAAGIVVASTVTETRDDGNGEPDSGFPLTDEDAFFDTLNREVCRARREEGEFVVLSLDRQDDDDASLDSVCELLDGEMRAYADIAKIGERVLVLVPEVDGDQHEPLLKRLRGKAESSDCGEIRIGLARFPQEAIYAEELIDLADRKRLVKGVDSAPSTSNMPTASNADGKDSNDQVAS